MLLTSLLHFPMCAMGNLRTCKAIIGTSTTLEGAEYCQRTAGQTPYIFNLTYPISISIKGPFYKESDTMMYGEQKGALSVKKHHAVKIS